MTEQEKQEESTETEVTVEVLVGEVYVSGVGVLPRIQIMVYYRQNGQKREFGAVYLWYGEFWHNPPVPLQELLEKVSREEYVTGWGFNLVHAPEVRFRPRRKLLTYSRNGQIRVHRFIRPLSSATSAAVIAFKSAFTYNW